MHDDISSALAVLKKGGVILYPTDTIWGLGGDATCDKTVERIFSIKQREDSRSMLILMENPAWLAHYVEVVPEIAWDLMDVAVNPLTIIYPGAKNLAKSLIAGDGSVGIRMVREPFVQALIAQFRKPIVSTSANISGQAAPLIFEDVKPEIREKVDYIVQYRQKDKNPGKPSEIIKLGINGEVTIIRKI